MLSGLIGILALLTLLVALWAILLLEVFARMRRLERRITGIERYLQGTWREPAVPASKATPEAAAASQAARDSAAACVPAAAAVQARAGTDVESVIAGRWLNYVGIIALLFGAAFFLKYAFENDWIGPGGRVATGLLWGAALVGFSHVLLGRGYRYFSEGIAGLGCAVLYLSLYAGYAYYSLFSRQAVFAGMVAVVAFGVLLALRRASWRIAFLSAVGGFITPVLLSTNTDQHLRLFAYVALLDAALLVLAEIRAWRSLEAISFAATQFFFWTWYFYWWQPIHLGSTLAFATLFFLLFLGCVLAATRRDFRARVPMNGISVAILLLNAFTFLLALDATLWPAHKWAMTLAVLALSALSVAAAAWCRSLARSSDTGERRTSASFAQLLFAGLALTFATVAIPVRLEGEWITIAWAVEGALLVWQGFRMRIHALRWAALGLLFASAFRLYASPPPGGSFLWNARFGAYAVTIGCFGAALLLGARERDEQTPSERGAFSAAGAAVHVLTVTALSLELWDFFGQSEAAQTAGNHLAQQLSLSLLWSMYAAGLIFAGVRVRLAALRWQGLALFALAACKVFFFDLSFLDRGYRILSFMVLGLLLLVVSFLYQRRLSKSKV